MKPRVETKYVARDVVPPHDLDIERAVLGAALLHPDPFAVEIVDALTNEDFYRLAHQLIFQAITRIVMQRQQPDLLTVMALLKDLDPKDDVGGPAYVASLVDGRLRPSNIDEYIAFLRQYRLRRDLMSVGFRLATEAVTTDDAAAVAKNAEAWVMEATQLRGTSPLRALDGDMLAFLPMLEERVRSRGGGMGITSGFKAIDRWTRGFHPGVLTILAARPSMGKSALALNMAVAAAMAGHSVAFFSIEMSREEILTRVISALSGVAADKILKGFLSDADMERIGRVISVVSQLPLHIDDSPSLSVPDMRAKVRVLQALRGCQLVVVDYLQLITPRTSMPGNRVAEVSEISWDLKILARSLGVPVLALSQLSRRLEERKDKEPQLSDLRESGSLEQDADNVAFIHRPEVYSTAPADVGRALYLIKKQRNGPTAVAELEWQKDCVRFLDAEVPQGEGQDTSAAA